MSNDPSTYLRHILTELEYLENRADGLDEESFKSDHTLKRAFVRSLEIIGEATKKLTDEFRAEHPDIPWREMAAMRDVLIHDYFGVDYDIVWDVVQNEVPTLVEQISRLLE